MCCWPENEIDDEEHWWDTRVPVYCQLSYVLFWA